MTKPNQEIISRLKGFFPKGSTVYTIMRHKSRSGKQRTIGVLAVLPNNEHTDDCGKVVSVYFRHPNYATAEALGLRHDRDREGVKINGCGMDMGFEIAYRLGDLLYGDGYALKHQWL